MTDKTMNEIIREAAEKQTAAAEKRLKHKTTNAKLDDPLRDGFEAYDARRARINNEKVRRIKNR